MPCCCKCCYCKNNSAGVAAGSSIDVRRCYCCSNLRTAFYSIWLHRKHNVLLTLLQIALPIGILLSSNCIHQSLIPTHEVIPKWTQPPAYDEDAILDSIKCTKNCLDNPWIFFTPDNDNFTKEIVELSFQYFYGKESKMTLDSKLHFLQSHTLGFDYGLVKNIKDKEDYLLGVVRFNHGKVKVDPDLGIPIMLNFTVYLASNIPSKPLPATMFAYDANDVRHYMPLMGIQLALSKAYTQLISSKLSNFTKSNNSTLPPATMPPITVMMNPQGESYQDSEFGDSGTPRSNVKPIDFQISIQQFPYPPHEIYNTTGDKDPDTIWVIPTALVLGFTVVIMTFAGAPVSHKETGFKLELHMMGMSSTLFWGGWIFNQFVIQLITVGLQTYLLFTPICGVVMVPRGSPTLWLLVLIAYNMASLSFMAFVSAFFKRSIMCTYVGATIWLLSFYFVMIHWPTYTQFWIRLISCVIPNAALLWAVALLIDLGGDWDSITLYINTTNQEGVNLIFVIIMLFADSIIYFILLPYIDHIRPGPYEVVQPWNYFFERWICRRDSKKGLLRGTQSGQLDIESNNNKSRRSSNSKLSNKVKYPASESELKSPSVEFVNLTKKYRRAKEVYAVDNVNFKVYPGKITVMLGHSGSGKTTLLRLLCGEYYPTKGTAYVLGLDVRHYRLAVTHLMSVCFERNLLSDYLTSLEHLILIGILKGLSRKEAMKRAHKLLGMLEITSIKNHRMYKLLEHEKSLLSVALALIGNSPVIVMDEVTIGLEPNVKQLVWNTLKRMKSPECTIIVFTSDMEEAYFIGDRIAIMSKGKIVGSGSSERIEKLFGTGYHLKILLEPGRDKTPVFDFVKDSIHSTEELESRLVRLNKAMQLVDHDEEQSEEPFVKPTAREVIVEDGISILHYLTFGFFRANIPPPPKQQAPTVPTVSNTNAATLNNAAPPPATNPPVQDPETTTILTQTDEVSENKKPTVRQSQVILVSDPGAFRKDPKKILEEAASSSSSNSDEPVELILLLPKGESKYFKKLFSYLETDVVKKNFGILSYRLKSYTMKQAFDEVDEYLEIEKVENTLENHRRSSIINIPGKERRSSSKVSMKHRELYINEKFRTVVHDEDDIDSTPLPVVPRGHSCCSKLCRGFQKLFGLLKRRLMWITKGWIYALVQIIVPILLVLFLMQATRDYYAPLKHYDHTVINLRSAFPHVPRIDIPIVLDPNDHDPYPDNLTALLNHYKSQLKKKVKEPIFSHEIKYRGFSGTEFYEYLSNLDKNSKMEEWNSTALIDKYLHEVVPIGVDFSSISHPIGYYSPASFHGPSLTQLALINTRMAANFPQLKNTFSLRVTSHPMQYKAEHLKLLRFSFTDKETFSDFEQCFVFAVLTGYGFFIFTSGFSAQPTTERLNLFKRLQLNTGVSSFSYWLCLFAIDFAWSFALGGIVLLITWYVPGEFARKSFSNAEFAKYFATHWILSSYTSILYSYIFSFYFRRGTTAYFGMLSINQVFGLFAFTLAVTLKEMSLELAGPLSFALHFLHPFTVPAGLYSIANVAVRNGLCRYMTPTLRDNICSGQKLLTSILDEDLHGRYLKYCCIKSTNTSCVKINPDKTESDNCPVIQPYITFNQSFFERWGNLDNATITFLFVILHAVVATFALYVIEKNVNLRRVCCRKKTSAKEAAHVRKLSITGDERLMAKFDKSESVRLEKVEVENCLKAANGPPHEFIVHEVTLQHNNRQLLTDISIVAEPGELCCIVGPPGSGKTKLFRILADETYVTEGNVYYSGLSLSARKNKKFLSHIGYSIPGKDFVFRRISGKEVVRLFGRLKGVPERVLKDHVNFWLNEFGIGHEASGDCEYFSDSTKQRLSLACCFIGDPEVLILDDPLPSLDPEGRLQFWTVVDKLLSEGRIILMTSSSMEIVQDHCSKIAIMVNGALKHVTSPYKLVEEFGLATSYTFVVYLIPDQGKKHSFELYTELKGRIKKDIPNVVLQKELHFSLRYHIEQCEIPLSDLFGLVDEISEEFNKVIKEYELRETSMEDIYDIFALKQNKYRMQPSTLDTFCLTYC